MITGAKATLRVREVRSSDGETRQREKAFRENRRLPICSPCIAWRAQHQLILHEGLQYNRATMNEVYDIRRYDRKDLIFQALEYFLGSHYEELYQSMAEPDKYQWISLTIEYVTTQTNTETGNPYSNEATLFQHF